MPESVVPTNNEQIVYQHFVCSVRESASSRRGRHVSKSRCNTRPFKPVIVKIKCYTCCIAEHNCCYADAILRHKVAKFVNYGCSKFSNHCHYITLSIRRNGCRNVDHKHQVSSYLVTRRACHRGGRSCSCCGGFAHKVLIHNRRCC